MNPEIQQALQAAIARHRQGDLPGAIAAYETLLRAAPAHLPALANLASALRASGRLEEASARFREALAVDDSLPALWFNQAKLLRDRGEAHAAEASYRRALALDPTLAPAWFNLGNVLRDREAGEEAETAYREALRLDPRLGLCWMNLGNLLRIRGRVDEALEAHRQAIALLPGNADAHYNLGNALMDAERPEEAIQHYAEALRRQDNHGHALLSLGLAQYRLQRAPRALACWQRLLTLEPDHLEARMNLAATLRERGEVEAAVRHYREAMDRHPDNPDIPVTLASTLLDVGQVSEALALLAPVVERHPDHAEARKALGNARILEAHIDAGLDLYREALACQPQDRAIASNLLFSSLYRDWDDPADLTALHREMAADIAAHAGPAFEIVRRVGDGPLRVGYLSADLRAHPVGFFMAPVLARHDPDAVRVHCYSVGPKQDEVRARLRQHVPHWRDAHGWSDTQLGERIIQDGVDILVDLSGHTAGNRPWLLARRPAPVQVLYLGYPCTSGLANMDYLLGDPHLSPSEYHHLYTETVVNLEGGFLCFRPPEDAPPVAPPPHRADGVITFGSFNHLPKLSPRARDLWARVLREVPDARLVLKALSLADGGVRERLLADFEARGIQRERITLLAPSTPLPVHLADYGRIDIGLDPVPYTASTTTCQALWMGVPVITLAGRHFHERMGVSVLHHAGLGELVARDEDDYVARAVALAGDPTRLVALRAGLRDRLLASRLCDEVGFTRQLEAAYRQLWKIIQDHS